MADSKTDVLSYSRQIAHGEMSVQELEADTSMSNYDKRQILALALYTIEYEADRRDARSRRHRRATTLLRSFLNDHQQAQLKRSGGHSFVVRGSLGNYYRLYPRVGNVWRVVQRGTRWSGIASYCLHDYAEDDPTFVPIGLPNEGKKSRLPAPDRTLAHLLMLTADEGEFRMLANESTHYIWSGWKLEWALRLREERRRIEQQSQRVAA